MGPLLFLMPLALVLGAVGLWGFLWTLKDGQYDDLDGAAHRIFLDNDKPEFGNDKQLLGRK